MALIRTATFFTVMFPPCATSSGAIAKGVGAFAPLGTCVRERKGRSEALPSIAQCLLVGTPNRRYVAARFTSNCCC
jgi:hypothetical protein